MLLLGWLELQTFHEAMKFSLEKLGRPERKLRREYCDAISGRTVLAVILLVLATPLFIKQVQLEIFGLRTKRLRSCTSRVCCALCVSSKCSKLTSAKYRREWNSEKLSTNVLRCFARPEVYVDINGVEKLLKRKGSTGQSKAYFILFSNGNLLLLFPIAMPVYSL